MPGDVNKNTSKKLVKIGTIAKALKVLPSTVRFYTDIGILKYVKRSQGGYRLYDFDASIKRWEVIKKLQKEKKLDLDELKKVIDEEFKKSLFKKVLIVDDDNDIRELFTEIFKNFDNWIISTASNGFEAGKKIIEEQPDLVFLDLILPGIDGFKVCLDIKKDEKLKHIKIIAITGYDSPEYRQKILDSGADDYLAKPLTPEDIKTKVESLFGGEN